MAIKDKDRVARANYRKKITAYRLELYGTDEDIKEKLTAVKEGGQSVAGYIKSLIRADIEKKA